MEGSDDWEQLEEIIASYEDEDEYMTDAVHFMEFCPNLEMLTVNLVIVKLDIHLGLATRSFRTIHCIMWRTKPKSTSSLEYSPHSPSSKS